MLKTSLDSHKNPVSHSYGCGYYNGRRFIVVGPHSDWRPIQSLSRNLPVVDEPIQDPLKLTLTRPGGGDTHRTMMKFLWWGVEDGPLERVSTDRQVRIRHAVITLFALIRQERGPNITFLKQRHS